MNILACLGDPIGCTWGALPDWAQWGLILCAVFFLAGVFWRFKDVLVWVKSVAGWPGVGAVVAAAAILVAALWPKTKGDVHENVHGKDAAPTVGPRKTWFPPKGKRVYNPDTNLWEDK